MDVLFYEVDSTGKYRLNRCTRIIAVPYIPLVAKITWLRLATAVFVEAERNRDCRIIVEVELEIARRSDIKEYGK